MRINNVKKAIKRGHKLIEEETKKLNKLRNIESNSEANSENLNENNTTDKNDENNNDKKKNKTDNNQKSKTETLKSDNINDKTKSTSNTETTDNNKTNKNENNEISKKTETNVENNKSKSEETTDEKPTEEPKEDKVEENNVDEDKINEKNDKNNEKNDENDEKNDKNDENDENNDSTTDDTNNKDETTNSKEENKDNKSSSGDTNKNEEQKEQKEEKTEKKEKKENVEKEEKKENEKEKNENSIEESMEIKKILNKISQLKSQITKCTNELEELEKAVALIWEIDDNEMYYYRSLNSKHHCCGLSQSTLNQSWFVLENVNYFDKIGGFKAIIKRMETTNCPLTLNELAYLFRPMAQLRRIYNIEYLKQAVIDLSGCIRHYIDNIPDIIVKNIKNDDINLITRHITYMMGIEDAFVDKDRSRMNEDIQLRISLKQLKSPYLENRINGLNAINSIINDVIEKHKLEQKRNGLWNQWNNYGNDNNEERILNMYHNCDKMIKWLNENEVLNIVLDRDKIHIEMIKRVNEIYKLLQYNNIIDVIKHIDPLWKLSLGGQHESIRHLIYENISNISKKLSFNDIKHLFKQIEKTPHHEFDTQFLQLIKNFTLHAYKRQASNSKSNNNNSNNNNNNNNNQSQNNNKKKSWFGLDLLWKFVQSADQARTQSLASNNDKKKSKNTPKSSSKHTRIQRLVSEEVAKEALELFLELLKEDIAISKRNDYMQKCVWHIQESTKVPQNLILLQQLIQTYPRTTKTWYGSSTTKDPNTQAGVIESLEKDYAIFDHLFQDLAFYKTKVTSILLELKESKSQKNKFLNTPNMDSNNNSNNSSANSSISSLPSSINHLNVDVNKKIEIQTLRIDDSSFGYLEQLQVRLDFLLFLLTHSSLRLVQSQYKELWDQLVKGANCREEQDIMYIWLLRGSIPSHYSLSNSDSSLLKLYSSDIQKFLFERCICKLKPADLSEVGYLLVCSFFVAVNIKSHALQYNATKKKFPFNNKNRFYNKNNNRSNINNINNKNLHVKTDSSITQSTNNSNKNSPNKNNNNNNNSKGSFYSRRILYPGRAAKERLSKLGFLKNIKNFNNFGINKDSKNNTNNIINNNKNIDSNYHIDCDEHYIDPKLLFVNDYDLLEGKQYFWDVVLTARINEVGNHAMMIINSLHLNFKNRIKKDEKIRLKQNFVSRCMDTLTKSLKMDKKSDSTNLIIKRMISLLKSFLETSQKFNSKNLNIMNLEIIPNKTFKIQNYILQIESRNTFGYLRKKIYEDFSKLDSGLIKEDIILKYNNKIVDAKTYDKKPLSILKGELNKTKTIVVERIRYNFIRNFLNCIIKQRVPDQYSYPIESSRPSPIKRDVIRGFKSQPSVSVFGKHNSAFDQLIPLLQNPNVGPAVWDILNLLPPSFTYVISILNLSYNNEFDKKLWLRLFNIKDPYGLLYNLQILSSIITRSEYKQQYFNSHRPPIPHKEWLQRFINLGGFKFICNLLFDFKLEYGNNYENSKANVPKRIRVSCVGFMIQIISLLLSMDNTFIPTIPRTVTLKSGSITKSKSFNEVKEKLVKKTLEITQTILNWSLESNNYSDDNSFDYDDENNSSEFKNNKSIDDDFFGQFGDMTKERSLTTLRLENLKVKRAVSIISFDDNDLGPYASNMLLECLYVLVGCIRTSSQFIEILFNMNNLSNWIRQLIFNQEFIDTTKNISICLQMLARVSSQDKNSKPISFRILHELTNILNSKLSQQLNCNDFFELYLNVFDHVCRTYLESKYVKELAIKIAKDSVKILQSYPSLESYEKPELCDNYLKGIIDILRLCSAHRLFNNEIINNKNNDYENDSDSNDNLDINVFTLVEYIYHDCLFNVPQQNDYGAKCKAVESRKHCYALLYSILDTYPNTLNVLQQLILRDPIWYHRNRRELTKVSWSYHPSDLERFPVRYCGLKNQGATCYMNSLVQHLYINKEFRQDILEARLTKQETKENNDDNKEDNSNNRGNNAIGLLNSDTVLYQMQLLFGYLLKSHKKFYDTLPFCKVFKTIEGEPMPLRQQQDVNEFCNRLFDQLENGLKLTQNKNCINKSYGGLIVHQFISKDEECTHRNERDEPFHTISLVVKNKRNIYEALDLYVEGDLLDGNNKYLCGTCDDKRKTLKRVCFKSLPKFLFVHLNRFEFDFNAMRRIKLNSRFEFPMELNLEKYTKEGLAIREEEEKLKNQKSGDSINNKKSNEEEKDDKKENDQNNNNENNEIENDNNELPNQEPELTRQKSLQDEAYYTYNLVGVIVHSGTAEAGHYYSYSQVNNDKWWEFNDEDVIPFDIEDLDTQTFGGKKVVRISDPDNRNMKIEKEVDKQYNAYMLVYKQKLQSNNNINNNNSNNSKKKDIIESPQSKLSPKSNDSNTVSVIESINNTNTFDSDDNIKLPQPIQQTIWQQNLELYCDKNIFDFEYLTFLYNIVESSLNRDVQELSIDHKYVHKISNSNVPTNVKSLVKIPKYCIKENELIRSCQIGTCFVFEVLIRSKDNASYTQWIELLYKIYSKSKLCRRWLFYKMCVNTQWFINTLFLCPHESVRLSFVDLILSIIFMERSNTKKYYLDFLDHVNDIKRDNNIITKFDDINVNLDSGSNNNMLINTLKSDKWCIPKFIINMFKLLATVSKYHRSYSQFFILLKGIAKLGRAEREFIIKIGGIRAIVAFYLDDNHVLHFNRKPMTDNRGNRQFQTVHPPNCLELIKLLSILIRSSSTSTYPTTKERRQLKKIKSDELEEKEQKEKPKENNKKNKSNNITPQPKKDIQNQKKNKPQIEEHKDKKQTKEENTSSVEESQTKKTETATTQEDTNETTESNNKDVVTKEENTDENQSKEETTQEDKPKEEENVEKTNENEKEEKKENNETNETKPKEESKEEEKKEDKKSVDSTPDKTPKKNVSTESSAKSTSKSPSNSSSNESELDFTYFSLRQNIITQISHPPHSYDNNCMPINITSQDIFAILAGLHPDYELTNPISKWDVPKLIDPLPGLELYEEYQLDTKKLLEYQKENSNNNNNVLPPEILAIKNRKPLLYNPRKLKRQNIIEYLSKDNNNMSNRYIYWDCISDILLYWSYNNFEFTSHIIDWLYKKIIETYNDKYSSGNFNNYLFTIEHLFRIRDNYFEKKLKEFLPKFKSLFRKTSSLSASHKHTLLINYSLMMFFQRLILHIPEIIDQIIEMDHFTELLETIERSHSYNFGMGAGPINYRSSNYGR